MPAADRLEAPAGLGEHGDPEVPRRLEYSSHTRCHHTLRAAPCLIHSHDTGTRSGSGPGSHELMLLTLGRSEQIICPNDPEVREPDTANKLS